MPVVTISRGSYSRGKEVAEALAEELNYECVSREILNEASKEFNIPEIKLARALHDAPSLLNHFQKARESYLNYFKSAFLEHMERGNIVYHGLAGHFFLQDIQHVLKVRINARMSDRVNEEMRRDHCTLDQAILKIKNDDKARRIWSKQVYGVDPWDSRLYDLVLCVDSLSVTDIVEILANTIRKKQFQESRDSLEKLNNMALHAKAKALIEAVSPSAEVKFSDSKSIEIYSIGSLLKSDSTIREHLTERLKEKLKIDTVDYKEPVVHPKNYINTFYNIEVH